MRRALVLVVVLAGLAVAAWVAVLLWRERLALFVLPAALRDVDAALRREPPQDEIDAAALRLLRLQEPGLDARGPCAVVLLRARGGGTLRVVCFQVSDAAREESLDDAEREIVFRHRLVDERGRRIDDVLGLEAPHVPTVAHHVEDCGTFDVLRLVDSEPGSCDTLFSVDRRGFVPHGWALPEALDWMPFAVSSDEESVFDRTLVERLLASDTADVLRALWLIETTDHDVPELRGLLDHTDPLVRARALRLVWQGVQVISQEAVSPDCRRYRALVGDLDPRVRLQAFWALLDHCNDWEAALDALKEDPNAAVGELAHWRAIICSEFDENRKPSCDAALWLLRCRSRFAVDTHPHDVWGLSFDDDLSSPAIADAMLAWLEDDLPNAIAGDESAWLAGKLEY